MITIQNYYTETADLKQTDLPLTLWKGHQFVDKVTQNGNSWDAYHASDSIKKTIDLFLDKLNEFMSKKGGSKTKNTKSIESQKFQFSKSRAPKNLSEFKKELKSNLGNNLYLRSEYDRKAFIEVRKEIRKISTVQSNSFATERGNGRESWMDFDKAINWTFAPTYAYYRNDNIKLWYYYSKPRGFKEESEKIESSTRKTTPKTARTTKPKVKPSTPTSKTVKPKKKTARELAYEKAEKVETISVELKMIKRFVLMHDKVKTQNQIRLFINALQKAIVEKRIRKTSPYAKEINKIQDYLIGLHGQFKNSSDILKVDIAESVRGKYLTLVGKQAELYSVKFIKSYINLQGKMVTNIKAKRLYNRIASAINSNKLTKKDRYWNEIESIMATLKSFVKKNVEEGMLIVSSKELNGLQGIVLGCVVCDKNLNGVNTIPRNTIMSSTDIVNLDFEKLGFTGKWKNLIGDPSSGFTAMIFGKPKMGKSYLAVDFSGYLARNHGTVLYVAREEGIDDTLQQKLKDKNVAHPDLYVSDYLPEDLSNYDFVFLDSVNKLGLTPDDLELLKRKFPTTSFVYIFQTTKQGNFRGGNEFQHDVDVVIEVPEKGKAIQFGRFNQGGELNIFRR